VAIAASRQAAGCAGASQEGDLVTRYRVTVDGRTYTVEVDDPRARPVTARVAGQVFQVDVEGVAAVSAPPQAGDQRATAPERRVASSSDAAPPGQSLVTAPIPGTIAKVVAAVGQKIERGDALLTIEAMKMFNVIRSPWAGTVQAVHVVEGKHVTQGELLVSFVPT
jgi:glutaconyl-CoA/methylmalonyl-CoA decarboxylase subunit gamma